jgi:hypothetical protein
MLILTRRTGETLMIGAEVSVTIVGVNGNQANAGSELRKPFLARGRAKYFPALKEILTHYSAQGCES